jgi:CubicO group peptidase (beta-lactamase class C family)
MRLHKSTTVIVIALLVAACGGGGSSASAKNETPPPYNYQVPPITGDGWQVGHLDDHGMDSALIVEMIDRIRDDTYHGIDGIAIVRNSRLLLYAPFRSELDEYDGWVQNTTLARHILHSTSKSVTSALVGIAIDQGYIASADAPFYSLFNYPTYENWAPGKDRMTLEDALTMRLGLKWDEWSAPYGTPDNDLHILTTNNTDFSLALLNLEVESEPGTTFTYNTAASIAIGKAMQIAVGIPMEEFADLYLFQPMQIFTAAWGRTPTGLPNGGSGLFLAPRDMVKFGELFVSGGLWNGQQIISSDWIEASVERHVNLDWSWTSGYGYQWWRDKFTHPDGSTQLDAYSTRGFGGQYIFCVPELQLVVAFTGHNYGTVGADYPFELMQDFIVRAISDAT